MFPQNMAGKFHAGSADPGGGTSAANREAGMPFRVLFESAPGLYLVLKPDDFIIVAVSEAYLRATMTERSAITGRKLFEIFPDDPNDPAADGVRNLRASLERVKTTGAADVMAVQRYPVQRPESEGGGFEERFWSPINSPVFSDTGQLMFIIHRVEDVTPFVRAKQGEGKPDEAWQMLESRAQHMQSEIALRAYDHRRGEELQAAHKRLQESEARLRESAKRFHFLAESMPQKIFTATATGEVDYFNRQWTEFTGLSFEQIRDWGWTQFIHPDDVEENVRRWKHSIDTGEFFEVEHRFRRADGEWRWHISRAHAMRDAHGNILMWIGSNTDIHDVKRAQAEAEQANRTKDKFLAALSHELRTPLTPVLMSASALEQEPGLSADLRDQLAMMRRNIELEARLIDDLLDLTRVARGKLELQIGTTNTHSLLEHTREIVKSEAAAKGVQVRFALEARDFNVEGDAARLHQVFWNILKNAIKFTPAGGEVVVRSSNVGDRGLRVQIEDNGAGIDPALLPNIFTAFVQGEIAPGRTAAGLGLGMAISNKIVELHGGAITAQSEGIGRGAKFTVDLTTVPSIAATDPTTQQASARTARKYQLLVIEDHQPTLEVLARLLRKQGHDVTTASSVATALDTAARHHFDLVISDIGLPDGNGIDLMVQLTRDYGLRGIALSGYGMDEDLARTKEAGFLAHLIKPINFQRLSQVLEQFGRAA